MHARLTHLVLAVACCAAAACAPHPPNPPVMPHPGVDVRVKFLDPHSIAVSPDSSLLLTEMNGTLLAVIGDTIVLRLTRVPGSGNTTAWAGHEVRFARDNGTKVEQTSFDGSITGAIGLAAISWILIILFREARY